MFYTVDLLDKALPELNKILGSSNQDGTFNYIYPVTTENIAGYTRYVNNFSTVLTVAGSGDHLLNCIYHGAREVTLFDINSVTYYLVRLKMAMLTKSRREFIDFFVTEDANWDIDSPKFFAESTYLSIRNLLPADVQQFWDTYYKWLRDNKTTPQRSELFRHIKFSRKTILDANDYLATDTAYKATVMQMSLVKIRFINCDLKSLPANLPAGSRFNTMLFSNLSDYTRAAFGISDGEKALDTYNTFLNDIKANHLALGGQLFFAYIYEASTGPGWTAIDNIADLPRHFDAYQLKTFPAISSELLNNHSIVDCVLIK